ncbi:hypothetical protein TVAG_411010 [Trichomonas vaginalis G3]|uniref:Right handed beta helix domain-containing protein n=1 Tax=Trichomonas vaginalis (strain ATCC PRA-98 / G3) TaxID=412133 RepID=A2DXK6_TRIV3|nr:pectin lyase-like family [Trichomonas vaginalis G3]EAY14835.1 hypothetical protein TVAG_411010 [Trichomonas vaginalis G3]KAI5541184.1 pectin lyase-like family [Trichomonas vaginalis G3]|eukprot:XP_001327058.1 hypothetical protein [Trichomonas vaginalis G3]
MNFTILSLARTKSLSSPISLSASTQMRNFKLQNARLSMFSHSFARFNNFKGSASFANSKFTNFMQSVVRFDAIQYSGNQYTTRMSITTNASNSIEFVSCLFHDINEAENNGAAIYASHDNIDLSLNKVSFRNCRSPQGNGGAVYFEGQNFHCKETCFMNCFCEYNGQAIYASTMNDGYLTFQGSNINECPNSHEIEESHNSPLFLWRGYQTVKQVNFTNNVVGDLYSGLNTDDSKSLIFTDASLTNNTGNILIGLEDARHNDDLSFVNLVNNKIYSSDYGLIYYTTKITLRSFVFEGNSPWLFHTNDKLEADLNDCVFDSDFSAANYSNQVVVTKNIKIDKDPKLYPISKFDTRYCWEINPPKLSAGPGTYGFLVFLALFIAFVGYALFIGYQKLTSINPQPLLPASEDSYQKQTE